MIGKMDNHEIVSRQYATAANLENRIALHEKYSTNRFGWFNWLFANYSLKPGDRILELGCGNGKLWAEKGHELPANASLVLSDLSVSMIMTAKDLIGEKNNIDYQVIDVQAIPFPEASFDVVIANMMLYHVPDLDQGLAEIRRVMKKDGQFYCATFGEIGIASYIRDALGLPGVKRAKFTLQNGEACLQRHFAPIVKRLYEDSLAVTDTGDLIAYIRTLPWAAELQAITDLEMAIALEARKQDGVIRIPKEYGMFIAGNEQK